MGRDKTNITFTLDGVQLDNTLVEWRDVGVLATFDNQAIQANVTIENFTFVNEAALQIRNFIKAGLASGVGIFEGMSFDITVTNGISYNVFNGYLDLTDGYREISPVKVEAKIKRHTLKYSNTC